MATHSLARLKQWSTPARERSELVQIARENSPSLAYDRAIELTHDVELAKATRWLAIIRRDHGQEEFENWIV